MIRYLLALLLCLTPVTVEAQTSYGTVLNHRTTGDPAVDLLCDKTRATATCVPFMYIDSTQNIARAADDKSFETISVMDFCKKSNVNGSTDNTSCIQAAVTYMCANGGGTIRFPARRYVVQGTVTACAGVHLRGTGPGDRDDNTKKATFIDVTASTTAPAFQFVGVAKGGNTFNWQHGATVSDMTIYQNPSNRTGPFIEFDKLQGAVAKDLYLWAPCTAVKVDGGFDDRIENVISEGFTANCPVMVMNGGNADGATLDAVRFQNVKINAASTSICYKITDRVQTVWWVNTVCQTGGKAIESTCPTMSAVIDCPGFFTLYDFESEAFSSTQNQIDITDMIAGFKMTDSWLRGWYSNGSVAHNISILPGRFANSVGGLPITIANNWIKHAAGSCLYIQSQRLTVTGNHIYGCGRNNDGPGYAAVEVRASYAAITGNTLCGSDFLGDANAFPNGVLVTNNADHVAITGNVIGVGCTNGYSTSGTTGTSISYIGNVGP